MPPKYLEYKIAENGLKFFYKDREAFESESNRTDESEKPLERMDLLFRSIYSSGSQPSIRHTSSKFQIPTVQVARVWTTQNLFSSIFDDLWLEIWLSRFGQGLSILT